MNILHVSCSPRGLASESSRLAHNIIERLLSREPSAHVVTRLVSGETLPHVDGSYATSQQSTADVSHGGSLALSDQLIAEVEQADVLVISTPMHNFSLPSALKAWIDHVARVRRTFNIGAQGKTALLSDRPVFIAIASGGRFSGERARQPDYLTPYLRDVLNMIGLHDLRLFSVQGTAMGPQAIDEARNQADEALQAHFSAARHA
jgi:FMN-dependent NADH-azoreductase